MHIVGVAADDADALPAMVARYLVWFTTDSLYDVTQMHSWDNYCDRPCAFASLCPAKYGVAQLIAYKIEAKERETRKKKKFKRRSITKDANQNQMAGERLIVC